MDILKLALKLDPKNASKILGEIYKHDQKIIKFSDIILYRELIFHRYKSN